MKESSDERFRVSTEQETNAYTLLYQSQSRNLIMFDFDHHWLLACVLGPPLEPFL